MLPAVLAAVRVGLAIIGTANDGTVVKPKVDDVRRALAVVLPEVDGNDVPDPVPPI